MHKLLLTAVGMVVLGSVSWAQSDTTYYDANWSETNKAAAIFYRPEPKQEGDGYRIQDFYLSGAIQMSAISLQSDVDLFDGEVIWYYESGQIEQKGNYQKGSIQGSYIYYDEDGAILADGVYEDGQPYEGSFYQDADLYQIFEVYESGVLMSQVLSDKSEDTKAKISWTNDPDNFPPYKLNYYDVDGKLIGSITADQDGKYQDGLLVGYVYSPMVVYYKVKYADGVMSDSVKYFFSTGELKQLSLMTDGETEDHAIYYDKKGNVIGELIYQDSEPYSGKKITYPDRYYDSKGNDQIESIESYEGGIKTGAYTLFQKNGKIAEKGQYNNGVKDGEIVVYDKKGKEAFKGIYKDGNALTGSFRYGDDDVEVYEKGVLVKEISYYPDSDQLKFLIEIGKRAVYYAKDGKQLGEITYEDGYPYNGTLFDFYRDLIVSKKSYVKGNLVNEKSYSYSTGVVEYEYFYNNDGRNERTIEYYSTGKPKIDTKIDEDYYKEITYFDKSGNTLGTFRYNQEKNGDEYFFKGDDVQEITSYKRGVVTYKKWYSSPGKALYEIDYEGDAQFFDDKGKLLSTATYREGEPYSGTVYTYNNYDKTFDTKATYVNGLLDGPFVEYDQDYASGNVFAKLVVQYKEGEKTGISREYFEDHLLREDTYKDDLLDGPTTYYDNDGKKIGVAEFKDGEPYSGIFYNYDYGLLTSTAEYKKGVLDGQVTHYDYSPDSISSIEKYDQGELIEAVSYLHGQPIYQLIYKDGEPYDGTLSEYYSLSYYEKGRLVKVVTYNDYNSYEKVASETVYGEEGDQIVKTNYFDNGQKRSVVHLIGDMKNGEVIYYTAEGELIGKGVYKEDFPLSGTFVYANQYDLTNYIVVEIGEWSISATVFQQDEKLSTIESKLEYLATDEGKDQHIRNFYKMISCGFDSGYDIDWFY